jgi:hypothetical protein
MKIRFISSRKQNPQQKMGQPLLERVLNPRTPSALTPFTVSHHRDVNPVIQFLPHALQLPMVDSRDCLHDSLSELW